MIDSSTRAHAIADLEEDVSVGPRTSIWIRAEVRRGAGIGAAVVTDFEGIQREAARLGTPCLALRFTREWVQAVEGSDGRLIVVGLCRKRVTDALRRLAPPATAEASARQRGRDLALAPAGADRRITEALATGVIPTAHGARAFP